MDVMSKNVECGATYMQIYPPDRGAVPGGPPDFPGDEGSAIYICPVGIVEQPVKSHRTKGSVHEGEHRTGDQSRLKRDALDWDTFCRLDDNGQGP
jgi:hypothetical protein